MAIKIQWMSALLCDETGKMNYFALKMKLRSSISVL